MALELSVHFTVLMILIMVAKTLPMFWELRVGHGTRWYQPLQSNYSLSPEAACAMYSAIRRVMTVATFVATFIFVRSVMYLLETAPTGKRAFVYLVCIWAYWVFGKKVYYTLFHKRLLRNPRVVFSGSLTMSLRIAIMFWPLVIFLTPFLSGDAPEEERVMLRYHSSVWSSFS